MLPIKVCHCCAAQTSFLSSVRFADRVPGFGLLAAGVYQLAAAVAGHFVEMTDPTAFWSCLSASAAAVAVAGMQIHASFTVDPQRWA